MDAAPPPTTTTDNDGNDDDNDPKALAAFEDFELSVLPALEKISKLESDDLRREMLEMDDMIAKGLPFTGGCYFAWSDCLKCMKIGATRRDNPHIRLREISRGVTSPFILSGWLPSPTPFRMEAKAHIQFAAQRIKCAGAGTEFFTIGKGDAKAYVVAMGQHSVGPAATEAPILCDN